MAKPSVTLSSATDDFNLNTYTDATTGDNPFATGTGGYYGAINGAGGTDTFTANLSAFNADLTMTGTTTKTIGNGASVNVSFSNFENINITAGGGNDLLTAGAGNDSLSGGAGNDVFRIGTVQGVDVYDGGAGVDLLIANFSGVGGNLTLAATGGTLNGTLVANMERFNVTTGSGDDTIVTSTSVAYADTLATGAGNDSVTMGAGNDRANGGDGTDTLTLNMSKSAYGMKYVAGLNGYVSGYSGGQGIATIGYSNFEILNVTGSNYSDTLVTGAGNDTIAAGAGNDHITSGDGVDVIDGGTGYDTWHFNFTTASTGLTINANDTTPTAVADGMTTYSNIERLDGSTGSGNDVVRTKDNAYVSDKVSLGAGDDTITSIGSIQGADVFDGGTGTDTLWVDLSATAAAFDIAAGPSGSVYSVSTMGGTNITATNFERFNITGGAGSDDLTGGTGNDTLTGGAGNDTLTSGGGQDIIDGGTGTDTYILNLASSSMAVSMNVAYAAARSSTGTISIGGATATDLKNIEVFSVTTGGGNDTLVDSGNANDLFSTGAGNDTVSVGYGGHDVVDGGSGTDKLVVNWTTSAVSLALNTNAEDTLPGAVVYGDPNASDSVVAKNFEIYEVHGGSANDYLVGASGADFLEGNGGNDLLSGGGGDDALRGDLADGSAYGSDIFQGSTGGGTDTILDAGAGAVADYINAAGVELTSLLAGDGSTVTKGQVQYAVGTDSTIVYIGLDASQGTDQIFVLQGDYSQTNRLSLESGNLKIAGIGISAPGTFVGTEADDTLTGTSSANSMDGKGGNDVMSGGGGADTLTGGAGVDTLTGGAGGDIFRFTALSDSYAGAFDTITDFSSGIDRISLSSIDPNPVKAGDQGFVFSTETAFSGVRGELIFDTASQMLMGDVNADGMADFQLLLSGVTSMNASDILL